MAASTTGRPCGTPRPSVSLRGPEQPWCASEEGQPSGSCPPYPTRCGGHGALPSASPAPRHGQALAAPHTGSAPPR